MGFKLGKFLKKGGSKLGHILSSGGKKLEETVSDVYHDVKGGASSVYHDARSAVSYGGKHIIKDVDSISGMLSNPMVIIGIGAIVAIVLLKK